MLMANAPVPDDTMMDSLEKLSQCVFDAAREGKPLHEVELEIWRLVLELGRYAMGALFELCGAGDVGETWQTDDGRVLRRLEKLHPRTYQSIFGCFELERAVYGSREGQKIEFVPLDTRLCLPEGEFSYVLQDWSQSLAVEHAYAHVVQTLQGVLGLTMNVDSMEHLTRQMAQSVKPYREALAPPAQQDEAKLLVVTADNKGISMRRPASKMPAGCRRKRGEKPGKKQMAAVGCVYTVDPKQRTAEQLVQSLFGETPPSATEADKEPVATNKRVYSSLSHDCQGEYCQGEASVFKWLAQEARQRLGNRQEIVCIMDGQHSLWDCAHESFQFVQVTEILDLMHVLQRLWDAAYLFHPESSPQARQFVRTRLQGLLEGKVGYVIGGLRQMASKHKLHGDKLKSMTRICNYLQSNRHRMRYDQYLKAGYPIASGVIEGACRYYVKDRMERSGMRWSVVGAQAMLDLRATYINGHWQDFQTYRIQSETQRLYPQIIQVQSMQWPFEKAA